ncbi:DUF3575 domain-containing protein [Flavobacterium sp. CYK-55]|uniref:DUF3575 domain-containing protein n=1 Tax=Flavobacterium sp. CYK-55 TaxID=2835529 RepID=UPI001BCC949A|nr:DUF3575 domain-containing protein [Flavobacterium sp. CYK-55]MBS7786825.1 DUF3575 domain-containing protein [Flavobacterium sp. CYK-55]
MKKYIFFFLLAAPSLLAQADLEKKHNEFRVELVTAIVSSKANLTYERFLSRRFSTGLTLSYANSKKVNDDFDEGNRNTIPKYEVVPFARYNLSNGQRSFYFAEVFLSANGGDFRETVLKTDALGNDYYVIEKSKYSDVAAGAGVGYKYYIKDKVGIEFLVGFGSNMFNKDKSPDIISRVGLSFGYRF